MKCNSCGSEWKTDASRSTSITDCPFCQESLVKNETPKSFDSVKEVLAFIASNKFTIGNKLLDGREILLSEKIVSFFSDIAATLKDEKELIQIIRDRGALEILKGAMNASLSEQEVAIKRAAVKLPAFVDKEVITTILYDFAEALGWSIAKPPLPSPPVVNVTIIHPANRSEIELELPINMMLRDVLKQLISASFIEAGPLYTAILKATSKPLDNNKTISENGISNNFTIQIKMEHTPKIGSIIRFSNYDWRVLDALDGKILIISDKIIIKKAYHSTEKSITWEKCELRGYLNEAFYNSFGQDKSRIVKMKVVNKSNPWYGASGGSDTEDWIFLLSLEEVCGFAEITYFGNSSSSLKYKDSQTYRISDENNKKRITDHRNGGAWWWWLRSSGKYAHCAASIGDIGCVHVYGNSVDDDSGGVRPALWLSL